MNKGIYERRKELYKITVRLNTINPYNLKYEKQKEIKEKETEYFNKWNFYHNFIKKSEELRCRENERNYTR